MANPPFKPGAPKGVAGPKIRQSPLVSTLSKQEQDQLNAMNSLIKERENYSKKYGSWPTDEQLMSSRKK